MTNVTPKRLHCFLHGWQMTTGARCPVCAVPSGGVFVKPTKIEFPRFERGGPATPIAQVIDEGSLA